MLGKLLQTFVDTYGYTATPIPVGTKDCKYGGYIISSPVRQLFELHRVHTAWCWTVIDIPYNKVYLQVGNIASVIKTLFISQSFWFDQNRHYHEKYPWIYLNGIKHWKDYTITRGASVTLMMHTQEPYDTHPFLSTSIAGLVIGETYTVHRVRGESMCDYIYVYGLPDTYSFDLRLFKIN